MANKYTATATSGSNFIGIPDDILQVHTNDVLFTAMPVMRYDQFAVVRDDLTKQAGDTIVFPKYGNLSRGGAITESDDLETKSMKKTTIPIQVTEYGNAVGLTSKYMTLAFMDEIQNAAILLGRDYAITTDIMLRDAVFSGTQSYLVNSRAKLKDIISTDKLALADIDNVVAELETGNVLKYVDANGEYYAGFFHPQALKSIKSALVSIKQYTYPELIFKGEVGEYNSVRFIATSNTPNGIASSAVDENGKYIDPGYDPTLIKTYEYTTGETLATGLYKSVIFGERAYGWAVALPVELREDPGQANFGRKRGLAWYSIMGASKINNENIMVIYSA